MSRCGGVIEDCCVRKLIEQLELASSEGVNFDSLSYKDCLKYTILNDPIVRVDIVSSSQFEVYEFAGGVINSPSGTLAAARICDFLLGATRVRRQYEDLCFMSTGTASSAWLLVTAYYCAFFASVELSKVFGRYSLGLDLSDLEVLKYKAVGSGCAEFFGADNRNFVGVERAGKLVFSSSGDRPHVEAWRNCGRIFRSALHGKGWPEVVRYIDLVNREGGTPSHVRNAWNYKQVDYFGDLGERLGKDFRKLVGSPVGADSWLLDRRGKIALLDPCIIPVVCELLSGVVINAEDRLRNRLSTL